MSAHIPQGYTGVVTGRTYNLAYLSRDFSQVVREYNNQVPIVVADSGCAGTCSGRFRGSGFSVRCSESGQEYDFTEGSIQANVSTVPYNGYLGGTTFSSTIILSPGTQSIGWADGIATNVSYKSTGSMKGSLSLRYCEMKSSVVEYPVILINNTLSLEPGSSIADDRVLSRDWGDDRPENSTEGSVSSTYGGLFLALNGTMTGTASMYWNAAVGYDVFPKGAAAINYLVNPADQGKGEGIYWTDPSPDIVAAARELMFRSSLQLGTSSTLQTVNATVARQTNVYRTDYLFVILATAVTAVAVIVTIPTLLGTWTFGRKMTLSPIEIAKAFHSPQLANCDSNAELTVLSQEVGHRRVRYGAVMEDSASANTILGIGPEKQVRKPHRGSLYEGC
ncbi:hypothetical protein LTR37_015066 [Vermiconidia calcicola]|uniref:Uncharacterized protein n=1 Tax=Vermiconidia calcicola TaxID=1690605 RepID=A0ACC3MT66_9PEZI|nr:hypothetical protein LTR37_015066 [Vermiconidia calcicola]